MDMIEHYGIKAKEIEALVRDLSAHLDVCMEDVQDNWKGESGNAVRIRLDEAKLDISQAQMNLADSLAQIQFVKEHLLGIPTIEK